MDPFFEHYMGMYFSSDYYINLLLMATFFPPENTT